MTQIETNNEIEDKKSLNFIEQIVESDLKAGKNGGRLNTRFPPEPNGYLHIGHAKAICMDFGIAEKFGGTCNLRFDDTNPVKEDVEYVDSIMEDIHWLGFDWGDRLYYASDYFPKLWDLAIRLIKEGKAYVDEQSSEEIARQKGTPTQPGIESPYRNRSVEENLDLFERMNKGGRSFCLTCENRHGFSQYALPRSYHVPYYQASSSSYRNEMECISHV